MRKAPWTDYRNNELFEGDKIKHPEGEEGTIIYLDQFSDPHDQWRVNYGTDCLSRLSLQIGDKGQAIKI